MAIDRSSMPLVNTTRQACTRALSPIGFTKRMTGVYTLDLSPGFLGWLGLNEATDREAMVFRLNPVAGVHSVEIERLVAELSAQEADEYYPPTISRNLGYVMPQQSYYSRVFSAEEYVERNVMELASDLRAFGLPFMNGNSTVETLCESMERGFGLLDHITYALPVGYLLLGQTERARECIAHRLEVLEQTPSPATDLYRAFAKRFPGR